MFHLKYILFMCISQMVNAFLIEDLESLFENKQCIEASLMSISSPQDQAVMIDKDSQTLTSTLINITEIKSNYEKNVLSKINELAQYNEIQYSYELISEEGPPHNKNFKVVLTLGDENYESSGSSLKKAQKAAAVLALENTLYEHPPIKLPAEKEKSLTPTVVLNNIAMKLGFAVSYSLITDKDEHAISSYGSVDESYGKSKSYYPKLNSSSPLRVPTEEPQITGPFTVRVKVGDSLYLGVGHTIQAARHDAATNAIKSMEKQVLYKNSVCANEDSVQECKQKKENLKSPVSRVYESAQKHNLPVEFNIISESGKSHQKVFITQCKLGDFVSEGEGNSKKESKKRAAEKMLENFPLLPDMLDGNEIVNGLKNKKKKKKKTKIIKNNVYKLGQSVSDMLTAFWSSNDGHSTRNANDKNMKDKPKAKASTDVSSPKQKLLELSNRLNIQVQFTDGGKDQENFYTLMSLGVHPLHICLGKAATRDKSHEVAALHGLKFLHKAGVLDKLDLSKDGEYSYYYSENNWDNDFEVPVPTEVLKEER